MVPGLRSIYRWQGEVCDDPEVLLIIKTVTGKMGQLTEKVTSLHPYDTPEVICLPASGGLGEYLKWVSESVGE
jgi:periplasmic divalent cation tolerance protein